MLRRLFPMPLLSLALVAIWLLLHHTLAPGQILLAIVVAVAAPALLAPLRPHVPRIRHPLVLARLIAVVAYDVIGSNWMIFRTLVIRRETPPHCGFVRIPLDLRDPNGIAALAVITTTIPGTVWCELARDHSAFLLHVWHAPDPDAFARNYKARYEAPLIRIFES